MTVRALAKELRELMAQAKPKEFAVHYETGDIYWHGQLSPIGHLLRRDRRSTYLFEYVHTALNAIPALLDALEQPQITAEEVRNAALEEAALAVEEHFADEELDGWEQEMVDDAIGTVRRLKSAALNRAKGD